MNEIHKNLIRRLLSKFGLRFEKYPFYKFPQDRDNYPELNGWAPITIFDAGANIGQSSLWFRHSFPNAVIHAFEPFRAIFQELCINSAGQRVSCHQIALSDVEESRILPRIADPLCQTAGVDSPALSDQTESVQLRRLDAVAEELAIARIEILKTDTEGHDLRVLHGGTQLFNRGAIRNVLVEASIDPDDHQHTNFFELSSWLSSKDMDLYSLYDLNHNHLTGRLQYFNALFKHRSDFPARPE